MISKTRYSISIIVKQEVLRLLKAQPNGMFCAKIYDTKIKKYNPRTISKKLNIQSSAIFQWNLKAKDMLQIVGKNRQKCSNQ